MKGLLIKEWYGIIYRFRIFMIILAALAVAAPFMDGNTQIFWTLYIGFIASMVPMNSMAYDERNGWDFYSQTLPVSKKQLVFSKYISGISFLIAGIALYLLGTVTNAMITGNEITWDYLKFLLMEIMIAGLLPMMITLPLNFKMGVEKGRMTMIVAIAIFAGCNAFLEISGGIKIDFSWITEAIIVLLILLCALSYHISYKIYEKREV